MFWWLHEQTLGMVRIQIMHVLWLGLHGCSCWAQQFSLWMHTVAQEPEWIANSSIRKTARRSNHVYSISTWTLFMCVCRDHYSRVRKQQLRVITNNNSNSFWWENAGIYIYFRCRIRKNGIFGCPLTYIKLHLNAFILYHHLHAPHESIVADDNKPRIESNKFVIAHEKLMLIRYACICVNYTVYINIIWMISKQWKCHSNRWLNFNLECLE